MPIAWPGMPFSKCTRTAPLLPCVLMIVPLISLPAGLFQTMFLLRRDAACAFVVTLGSNTII